MILGLLLLLSGLKMRVYVSPLQVGVGVNGGLIGSRGMKSQKYHLENPYWKTFDPYVVPLLEKPMDLRRHEELDTSKDVEVPL
jgi:hypothetical protein